MAPRMKNLLSSRKPFKIKIKSFFISLPVHISSVINQKFVIIPFDVVWLNWFKEKSIFWRKRPYYGVALVLQIEENNNRWFIPASSNRTLARKPLTNAKQTIVSIKTVKDLWLAFDFKIYVYKK